jgi:hypothetical protein
VAPSLLDIYIYKDYNPTIEHKLSEIYDTLVQGGGVAEVLNSPGKRPLANSY